MIKLQHLLHAIWQNVQARFKPACVWMSQHRLLSTALGVGLVLASATMMFSTCDDEQAIKERIVQLAKERYGLQLQIRRIHVGWHGIQLHDVKANNGKEGGLTVSSDEVWLEASPVALLARGSAALTGVRSSKMYVHIDVSRPGMKPWLKHVMQSTPAKGLAKPSKRRVEITDFAITLRDDKGVLMEAAEGEIRRDEKSMVVRFGQCDMGATPAEVAQLRDITIRMEQTAQRRVLKGLRVRSAALSWAPGALQTRMRLMHVRELLSEVRRSSDNAPLKTDAPWAWLAPHAHLKVDNLSVQLRNDQGTQHLLKQLHGELKGDGSGRFVVQGDGKVHGGGGLHWGLELWPKQMRAEGTVVLKHVPLALFLPVLPELPWYAPENTLLEGQLALHTQDVVNVAVAGELTVQNVALYSPRIADLPVSSGKVSLQGKALWHTATRRLDLHNAHVSLDQARAAITGVLEHDADHYLVDLNLSVPMTSCNTVMGAIPRQLLGEIVNFSWNGNWGSEIHLHVDSRDYDATEFAMKTRNQCSFLTVPVLADLRTFQGPFLHRVYEPDGAMFEMQTGPGTSNWTPIEVISPYMIHAVLAQEDAGFFKHRGFATAEMGKALGKNLKAGRYVQGASTISMQLVKNLLLHREKTLARKVQEVLLTWWVEQALDKKKILELYLNVIEFGLNVYGIRHASVYYFGRLPAELSPAESVFLSLILPNPKAYSEQYERGALADVWRKRIQKRLEHLYKRGRIDAEALAYGLQELDSFQFYRGDAKLAPRTIPGHASPLPFNVLSPTLQEASRVSPIEASP